jgi:hypothetical protein
MKKILSISTVALILIALSGCCKNAVKNKNVVLENTADCVTACAKIVPSESSPQISSAELESGMYYGNLDQKKKGTPNDWIHILEGTRSAAWCSPKASKNYNANCDCKP